MAGLLDFDLDIFFDKGQFSTLDYYFAKTIGNIFKETCKSVIFTCALLSKAVSKGHICLDLKHLSSDKIHFQDFFDIPVNLPALDLWRSALTGSDLVSDNVSTPLVLDVNDRLYLSRYYDFQSRLIQNIMQRIFMKSEQIDPVCLNESLNQHFNPHDPHTQIQKDALIHALSMPMTIISGGPGTGKTHVSGIIKNVFMSYARENNLPQPSILSVAPTGKAASKMSQGKTIHSALKPLPGGTGFYYNKKRQLTCDMVIIDEASMIDMVLLTRLLEAIPIAAKIILLGDKNQLASIQAGSAFNDICSAQPLVSTVFFLEYNFRSKGKTGIEKLSRAIKENHSSQIEKILVQGNYEDVIFVDALKTDLYDCIRPFIKKNYQYLVQTDQPSALMSQIDDFKILCAHNYGDAGTLSINHLCENILRSSQNFDMHNRYFNRIVMIGTNDYHQQLFNGDTGILIHTKNGINAFFKDQNNQIKKYRLSELPGHDTAFAITIHKSQGSEFNCVLIIIPDYLSPVLTRQLIYTGVTRAKTKVIITGSLEIIKKAVNLSVLRTSGLKEGLEIQAANKKNEQDH